MFAIGDVISDPQLRVVGKPSGIAWTCICKRFAMCTSLRTRMSGSWNYIVEPFQIIFELAMSGLRGELLSNSRQRHSMFWRRNRDVSKKQAMVRMLGIAKPSRWEDGSQVPYLIASATDFKPRPEWSARHQGPEAICTMEHAP